MAYVLRFITAASLLATCVQSRSSADELWDKLDSRAEKKFTGMLAADDSQGCFTRIADLLELQICQGRSNYGHFTKNDHLQVKSGLYL